MDRRRERVAENEVRFRDINERLRGGLVGVVDQDESVDFVCECGHGHCTTPIAITTAQYEAVRSDARDFVVRAGHEIADVEAVIARCDGYSVVRKAGDAVPFVREHDPRR